MPAWKQRREKGSKRDTDRKRREREKGEILERQKERGREKTTRTLDGKEECGMALGRPKFKYLQIRAMESL